MGTRQGQIDRITWALRCVWHKHPELKLGQLLENLYGCNCIFHREDDVIDEVLQNVRKTDRFPQVREEM